MKPSTATMLVSNASGIRPGSILAVDGRYLVVESVHRGAVIIGRPRLRDWIAIAWMRAVDAFRNAMQWGAM